MIQRVFFPFLVIATLITSFTTNLKLDNTSTTLIQQFEGCTPGYWKQPKHLDSWLATGYSPSQTLESVFDVPDSLQLDNKTLLQALSFKGGSTLKGAAQNLLRAAVAALLNSAHPDVNYPRTTAQVIADVNAALASNDRSVMLALANALDGDNNQACPLALPPTSTPTPTATNTSTITPTSTSTSTPTNTPTVTPTDTPTNTPTNTPTDTPTSTPTNTPTDTPTSTPTNTPLG